MDYSNCVSVHAEQNAIISASRDQMIGSTLYLVGYQEEYSIKTNKDFSSEMVSNKRYVEDAEPCSLCKRMIINAGIKEVVVRDINSSSKSFNVSEWTKESITGGY